MFKVVKRLLLILPMLICLVGISNNQQEVNAADTFGSNNVNTINSVNTLVSTYENKDSLPSLFNNEFLDQEALLELNEKAQDVGKTVNFGQAVIGFHSFGLDVNGCHYQLDLEINAHTGELWCGNLVIFCPNSNSLDIYTAGNHC